MPQPNVALAPVRLAAALLAALAILGGIAAGPGLAAPGDTTWVHTWQDDFINWATPHDSTFVFPDTSVHYAKVVLFYRIGCPPSPGDCDPWDRLGYLRLAHENGRGGTGGEKVLEWYEIARIVTPYDITPSPGSCTWEIDVSDYEHLLHGDVRFSNYIESWIGGNRGWLVTLDFAMIEGEPEWKPYQVVNLWANYYTPYGNQNDPIENYWPALTVPIDGAAERVKARIFCTGHGQGNTGNCAEFCNKWHQLVSNGVAAQHNLWRADCNQNLCRPQGGTWAYARAGWCPGDDAPAWDVDISSTVTPGTDAVIDYNVQPYTNLCCPVDCNPACVNGTTCADCNYNYNGHTPPVYALNSHLVFYRRNPASGVVSTPFEGDRLEVRPNAPNPFRPPTTISYLLPVAGAVDIRVLDAGGRLVRRATVEQGEPGEYQWTWDGRDGRGDALPAGVYFCEVRSGARTGVQKMLLVK